MWNAYNITNNFTITNFFSAFDRICNEGFVFKGESHDFWELIYVIDGSIVVSADERVVKLSQNQLLFHRPMEFHTQRVESSSGAYIFVISFSVDGDFMKRFEKKIIRLDSDRLKELMGILDYLRDYNNISDIAPSPVAFLKNIKKDSMFGQKLKNMTENFLINISSVQAENNLVVSSETKVYRKAMNIIDENLCENLTVSDVAYMCNVSPTYLKKVFAKYTGLGVHKCILKSKIAYAKQLLDAGLSVSQIADKLSFSTSNYFSVVFRREMGISPMEYKKR